LLETLNICSPKRNTRQQSGWEGFFPYYAGFSEGFANALLSSAMLTEEAVVCDPWNGSGTTTYTASRLGLASVGLDLNPVMLIVARARLLPPTEADSIEPLANEILRPVSIDSNRVDDDDPLTWWFGDKTAATIRAIENSIREHLVGPMTLTPEGTHFERISGMAATFYVALFSVCCQLAKRFLSSNPTWLRRPRQTESRIGNQCCEVKGKFLDNLRNMAGALAAELELFPTKQGPCEIRLADSTKAPIKRESIDFVLTSPPYCTRIDYIVATRIELAVLWPMVTIPVEELRRQMIGSTRVPREEIEISLGWGRRCAGFLDALKRHPSKASAGYYYRNHLDYFDKIGRSISKISVGLKTGGTAVLVVQDSYYKELHNDLPSIIEEMGRETGLVLRRRDDFRLARSMAGINSYSRKYNRTPGALEAVLCFQKL
jgi:hypothetical protein